MAKLKEYLIFPLLTLVIPSTFFYSLASYSGMPEKDYKTTLQLVEKRLEDKKKNRAESEALSSSMIKLLLGRYYEVGDHWDVAAWQFNHGIMRMTSDPKLIQSKVGNGSAFHYEVTQVKPGTPPEVILTVTQIPFQGLNPIDPKVKSLSLTLSDQLVQTEKHYYVSHTSGTHSRMTVSPDGVRSNFSPLELFPLDVPDITTADRKNEVIYPKLPSPIQEFAEKWSPRPDLSKSFSFEQDDFFGRPIQILWQQGDPWPSYMKTSGGIAILIHKGAE